MPDNCPHCGQPMPVLIPGEDDFEKFYADYPRKEGKGAARRAFKVARKKASMRDIMLGLHRSKAFWKGEGRERRLLPMPATWLNGERWNDDYSGGGQESPEAAGAAQRLHDRLNGGRHG